MASCVSSPSSNLETKLDIVDDAYAGIYYSLNSLKAKLCVDGNLRRLEPYCQEHGVPFKRIGKLLVATDESQIEKLRGFQQNAKQNGVSMSAPLHSTSYWSALLTSGFVPDGLLLGYVLSAALADGWSAPQRPLHMQVQLEWLERDAALRMEPQLHCVAALWSPNSAIVDSHRCEEPSCDASASAL